MANTGKNRKDNKRKRRLRADVSLFVQKYARKRAAHDPNDRDYDRRVESKLRNINSEELNELMNE